jgi:hypothetical protein
MVKTLQRHGNQLDYLAKYMAIMQEGVDAANRNVIQQLQDFASDFVVLLGGGQLLTTVVELGDLKYILPALGALFGFGDSPFPVNLFNAAMHFFKTFLIPNQQFTDAILDILTSWAKFLGIDPRYIEQIRKLFDAITDIFGSLEDLINATLALWSGNLKEASAALENSGPLGRLIGEIVGLFKDIDVSGFPNLFDLVLGVLAPFIDSLTDIINLVNGILLIFGAVVDGDLAPLENWWQTLFGMVDWNNPLADVADMITEWFSKALQPILDILTGNTLIPPNLIPNLGVGSIGYYSPNLLRNSGFNNKSTVKEGGGWSWEGKDGRSPPLGCAKAVVTPGKEMFLLSLAIPVEEKQRLNISAYIKYAGLTFSGSEHPVQLRIYGYDDKNAEVTGSTKIVGIATAPTPMSGNWIEAERIKGTYTVPAGVTSVKLGLIVRPNALTGTVLFDDLFVGKVGLLDIAKTEGLSAMFEAINDGLQADRDKFQDLLDSLGDKWGASIQDIKAQFQSFRDKIAAQQADSKKFWDEIKLIFEPGGSPSNDPLTDAIAAISGIYNTATSAKNAAEYANLGVAALRAEMNGGFVDEINYQMAKELTVAQKYQVYYSGPGTCTYGPNGEGVLVFHAGANTLQAREIIYRRTDNPITKVTGHITVVFTKPPYQDLLTRAWAYICVQMSAVDMSCIRARIGKDTMKFQTVDPFGKATDITGDVTIPQFKPGDVFELDYTASVLTMKKNGIVCASSPYVALAGKNIGVGASIPGYIMIGANPAPEIAGWAWA